MPITSPGATGATLDPADASAAGGSPPGATTSPPGASGSPSGGTDSSGSAPRQPTPQEIADAAKSARGQIAAALAPLLPYLLPASAVTNRKGGANAKQKAATPMLSQLLRDVPDLTSRYTPDQIDAATAAGAQLDLLFTDLKSAMAQVAPTARAQHGTAWSEASVVLGAAEKDKNDATVTARLPAIQQSLAKGSRVQTATHAVADAQADVVKAQTRLGKATTKATLKVRSQARATEAQSDAHPAPVAPASAPAPSPPNASR